MNDQATGSVGWMHPERSPTDKKEANLAYGNFESDDIAPLVILLRELIQNLIDAEKVNANQHRITIKLLTENVHFQYLRKILEEIPDRLESNTADPLLLDNALVIEEEGFKGLTGPVDNRPSKRSEDDTHHHFRHFFFSQGTTVKIGAQQGRANQGKITYYMASRFKTIFALSNRYKEVNSKVLFGKTEFPQTYRFNDTEFKCDSYWCWSTDGDGKGPQGITCSDTLEKFAVALNLEKVEEYGTSWVIPQVDKAEYTPGEIIPVILEESIFAIVAGKLKLRIFEKEIDGNNIDDLDNLIREFPPETCPPVVLDFMRDCYTAPDKNFIKIEDKKWNDRDDISEIFSELSSEEVSILKRKYNNDQLLTIRLPVTLKKKDNEEKSSHVDVFIKKPDGIEKSYGIYIRTHSHIKNEWKKFNEFSRNGILGLVWIREESLCEFLALAENPSHTAWKGTDSKLIKQFERCPKTLKQVRDSLIKVARFFEGSRNEEVDFNALSQFFSIPEERTSGQPSGNDKNGNKHPKIPELSGNNQRFSINQSSDGDKLRITAGDKSNLKVPLKILIELAYESRRGNPFKKYDSKCDFDISNEEAHEITSLGCAVISRSENRCQLEINSPGFSLEINGFGSRLPCPLKVKIV